MAQFWYARTYFVKKNAIPRIISTQKVILIYLRSLGRCVWYINHTWILVFDCHVFMKAYNFLVRADNLICKQQLDLNLPYMKPPPADQGKVLAQTGRRWRISVLHFCAYVSLRQLKIQIRALETVNHHNN